MIEISKKFYISRLYCKKYTFVKYFPKFLVKRNEFFFKKSLLTQHLKAKFYIIRILMYVHLCCLNLPLFTYPRFDMNRHTHSFFSFAILNQVAKVLINCNTHEYHGTTWLQETCTRKWEEICCKKKKTTTCNCKVLKIQMENRYFIEWFVLISQISISLKLLV